MFEVLIVLALGVLCGFVVSRFAKLSGKRISKIIMFVIFLLLFILGLSIGGNKKIVNSLHTLGFQSILISVFSILGSVILARIAYSKFFGRK
ncbi:MAG: LysO family transporter [Bacteroidales bacterium]